MEHSDNYGKTQGVLNKNPLNSRFFDSSCDDSSSSTGSEKKIPSTSDCHHNSSSIDEQSSSKSKNSKQFLRGPQLHKFGQKGENRRESFKKKGVSYEKKANESLSRSRRSNSGFYMNAKVAVLVIIWIASTVVLIAKKEKVSNMYQISVPSGQTKSFFIAEKLEKDLISLTLEGAFLPHYYANLSTKYVIGWLEAVELTGPNLLDSEVRIQNIYNISDTFAISLVSEDLIDTAPVFSLKKVLEISDFNNLKDKNYRIRFQMETNLDCNFPLLIDYDLSPIDIEYGVLYAALVLLLLYILIIFEVVHRTLASLLAANVSVAVLAALDERPSIAELASWIDFETLLLLFSMMILVAIFSETGIFDFLAVYAYQLANGQIWPLINTLCCFTAFLSCFLDNVTTSLLMTPVTIRLCEVMSANPVPVLMAMMIYANIGGAITPVGDPPNVILASNADVKAAGVDFNVFFAHMFVGLALVAIVVHVLLRIMFRNIKMFRSEDPHDVEDLRHEIAVWEKAAASISSYSKDEDNVKESLHKSLHRLAGELTARLTLERVPPNRNYTKNLADLKERYPIRNKPLLFKSGFTLLFVIVLFFLHSIPDLNLSLGSTAFMGALLLLLLSSGTNMEGILARVEWGTLMFFASLFILMEALSRLRLIEWIGQHTEDLIQSVHESYRLPVAILLILWISAAVSAFVDNIPLTTMMIRIVTSLAQNSELGLPLMPLVWALCYGACLGGLATLIGSSSNVVCAGVAEQHGYRFTFVQYSKVGVPVSLVSMVVISIYLLICHVVLEWNV